MTLPQETLSPDEAEALMSALMREVREGGILPRENFWEVLGHPFLEVGWYML